jgi:hypothetical protein
MPKFLIDVEIDGYDSKEEMIAACSSDEVQEALQDYGFMVLSVEEIE